MRAITVEEIERIAGGLKKLHSHTLATPSQTLTTVHVTGRRPPDSSSGASGGFGGFGGGNPPPPPPPGGGGGGDPTVTDQEVENAMKTALDEAAEGLLDSSLAGDLFTATDYATMAAHLGGIQIQDGTDSYNSFETWGDNSEEVPQYGEFFHWDRIDWSAYDENGHANANQAMANLFNDINVNHHVALTPQSTWSS